MPAPTIRYTDAEAVDLFDEAMGNRNPAQAVAIVRAIQLGHAPSVMLLVRALVEAAQVVEADQEDAERDEEAERADHEYQLRKDARSEARAEAAQ